VGCCYYFQSSSNSWYNTLLALGLAYRIATYSAASLRGGFIQRQVMTRIHATQTQVGKEGGDEVTDMNEKRELLSSALQR